MNQEIDREQVSYSRRILDLLRIDPVLFSLLTILSTIGVVLLYSAGGADTALMMRQAVRLALGFFLLIVVANIPLRLLKKISLMAYLTGVALLLAVMFFGEIGKGAQRWLDLGFLRFQPAEILKLAVPMVVAAYLSNRILPLGWKDLIISVLLVMIPV